MARKSTAAAISSGVPCRPTGVASLTRFIGPAAGFMSVSVCPGCTKFTVTPEAAKSRAQPFVYEILSPEHTRHTNDA